MQHTPGPWKHVGLPGGWDGVTSERDGLICKLVYNNPANASLIAEAPALKARVAELESLLEEAICYDWEPECPPKELMERIDKALAGRKEG